MYSCEVGSQPEQLVVRTAVIEQLMLYKYIAVTVVIFVVVSVYSFAVAYSQNWFKVSTSDYSNFKSPCCGV